MTRDESNGEKKLNLNSNTAFFISFDSYAASTQKTMQTKSGITSSFSVKAIFYKHDIEEITFTIPYEQEF